MYTKGFSSRPAPSTSGALLKRTRRVRGTRGVASGKASAAVALATAKRALQAARKLSAERELKVLENNLVNQLLGNDVTSQWASAQGAVIGNGGAVFPLVFMPQGLTGEQARVGEQILVKCIDIRGHYTTDPDVASSALRMIVFRDKQQRNTSPVPIPGEVLQLLRTNSLLLWDNIDRYEILCDKTYETNKPQVAGYASRVGFQWTKKVEVPVHYAGSANNSVDRNGLYMLLLADHYTNRIPTNDTTHQFTAAVPEGMIDIMVRVMFQDC